MCKPFVNLVVVTAVLISTASICQAREEHLMVALTGKPEKKSTWASITDSVSSGFKKGWGTLTKPFESNKEEPEVPDPTRISTPADPSADLHVAIARNLEEKNLSDDAEKQYQEALKKSPKHLKALLGYGRFLDRQERFAEGVQCYHKAIKAHPKDTRPLNHLALCLASHGLLDEAASTTEKAIRLEPKRAIHRNNMAIILVEMGNNEAAFGHLRAVHDEATAYYNLGHLLQKRGDSKAALDHFAMALKRNPESEDARAWVEHLQKNRPKSRPRDTRIARNPNPMGTPQTPAAKTLPPNRARPVALPQRGPAPPVNTHRWAPPGQLQAPHNNSIAPELSRPSQSSTLHQPPHATSPIPGLQKNPLRLGTPWPRSNQATPTPVYRRPNSTVPDQAPQTHNVPTTSSPAPRQNNGSANVRWGSFFQRPVEPQSTSEPRSTNSPRPSTRELYGPPNTNVVYPLPPVQSGAR